jgi:hypothetical protein
MRDAFLRWVFLENQCESSEFIYPIFMIAFEFSDFAS